jgi:diguanylate cyclase (GGDEF)-like protein
MQARAVVVFDVPSASGDRRLLDTLSGTGTEAEEVETIDAFAAALRSRARIGVVAFEALWPDPQRSLRALRDRAPGARIIVAHEDDSPRLRLGQRLWSVGLCDYFISRSSPPHELAPVLRQAQADALIESSLDAGEDDPAMARLYSRLKFLHNLNAALTNQRKVESLVREVQMKLPQIVDYTVLEVLIAGENESSVYVFQTRPIEHEVVWRLAEDLCAAVAPFCETPLSPETLTFIEGPPSSPSDEPETQPAQQVTIPMVFCGQLVGGIAIASTASPITAEHHALLQLVAYQLATSLRNAQALEAAESESLVDELTGAYKRRYLRRALPAEWRRAQRYKIPVSFAMIDIDHFKRINDEHGHLVGDQVLHAVASQLKQQLRDTDHLVRWGGEEFLLILPETNLRDAVLVLERIRLALARMPVLSMTNAIQITASCGVAGYPVCAGASPEEMIHMADEALLRAKRTGRDRVCIASSEGFGDLGDEIDSQNEKRRFSRIRSRLPVRYVELPELGGRVYTMSATDVSPGGIAISGPKHQLKKNAYALVYVGDEQKPLLSQVMWTRDSAGEGRLAGLQFIGAERISPSAAATQRGRALVIAQDPTTSATIERVMRAAQYAVKIANDANEIRSENLDNYNLLVLGESSLRGELAEQLMRVRESHASLRIALINETSQDRRSALDAIRAQHADHLIPSASSEDTLFATLSKLLLEEYFGVKKYLLWGAETRSWTLTTSLEKQGVLDGIKQVAIDVRCHPRIADLLVAAVDEMIINALYRPLPTNIAPGEKPVTVECGSDGRFLGVAVLDEHGLFRDEDLFRGIGKALEHEEKGLPEDATHAHLGFRIMLSTLSHLIINVDPGRCTEIIGLVDLRKSLKEFRTSVPSLGMFTDQTKK